MPDKIEKFRRKLDAKRRAVLDNILARIKAGDFIDTDMKKLEGKNNRFRIRKGNIRVKFSLNEVRKAVGIEIEWRDDTTYR